MKSGIRIAVAAVAIACAGAALAQSPFEGAIKARKAHMQLNAFNLGQLGAMAKGEAEYNAEAAAAHAANLVALSSMSMTGFWPEGSAQGEVEGTRALPALWTDSAGVMEDAAELNDALTALNAAAGTDLASLQAATGPVGEACGACHKAYRATE